jgi:pimeloyl-ACP methyl ester carboxylesterase
MQVTCLSDGAGRRRARRFAGVAAALLAACFLAASCSSATTQAPAPARASGSASAPSTVWLCRPGLPDDPCTQSLKTTVVSPAGAVSISTPKPATSSGFACFYVYGTVSAETSVNANLAVQSAEVDSAIAEASPFAPVCQVYAPIYRQVTVADLEQHPDLDFGPPETVTAYDSIRSGFEAFLAQLGGRPFVVIGHSQGAAMLNLLLANIVDPSPALRARLVVAVILGGNVEVPRGQLVGGTFKHIPACSRPGQAGCVIAFSSFPATPPAGSLFGRPGQGVSLQSGQTAKAGLQVVCVNPAALAGGTAPLDTAFPTEGKLATPWVALPGLYTATCEQAGGASWLNVTRTPGRAPIGPVLTETGGPDFGYHVWDLLLAQGNLVSDVAAAEATWARGYR